MEAKCPRYRKRRMLATIDMSWLRAIYNFFYEIFFGCSHDRLTRPFTMHAHSYKVCLDCGSQFPYSLEKMRLLHPWEVAKLQPKVTELTPVSAEPQAQENFTRKKAIA